MFFSALPSQDSGMGAARWDISCRRRGQVSAAADLIPNSNLAAGAAAPAESRGLRLTDKCSDGKRQEVEHGEEPACLQHSNARQVNGSKSVRVSHDALLRRTARLRPPSSRVD